MQAFTLKVDTETVKSIMNTVYAVFLGLLFTFFLSLDTPDMKEPPQVSGETKSVSTPVNEKVTNMYYNQSPLKGTILKVYVNSNNYFPVVLMSLYFLFDWFSFNMTIIQRKGVNHLLVIALTIVITYLGLLIILAFVPSPVFYIAFALYAVIVPWWDICLKNMLQLRRRGISSFWGIFIARFIVASLFLLFFSMNVLFKPDGACKRLHSFAMTCLCIYVILKISRYFLLAHFTKAET